MKQIVNIARVLVGILFLFSGLVKAIDPLGLAYKMQEFFEVWANGGFMKGLMMWLYAHAVMFSVFMIILEVVLGFALLLGWKKSITSWLLLLLTLFFTFLTAFVLFTDKIRACGCFGDCIPLTPIQTFTKDLVLLLLIIIILLGRKYIQPLFKKETTSLVVMLLVLFGVSFLQYYVLRHLPIKDCLPYKAGNNILELRKMPKDAIQDKFVISFIYEKNGVKKEFTVDGLPDSTWTYVDRKQKLIEKGKNNTPLINDFTLNTPDTVLSYEKDGTKNNFSINNLPDSGWKFIEKKSLDSTETVLSQDKEYYLLFIKEIPNTKHTPWLTDFYNLFKSGKPCYVVSSIPKEADAYFNHGSVSQNFGIKIFTCDGVAIKTVARNNVVLYLMKGPVVQGKWAWTDFDKIINN